MKKMMLEIEENDKGECFLNLKFEPNNLMESIKEIEHEIKKKNRSEYNITCANILGCAGDLIVNKVEVVLVSKD